eukprot:1228823-Pyramimonas_sp.AAC.1
MCNVGRTASACLVVESHIGFARGAGLPSLARYVLDPKPLSTRAACSILQNPHCDDSLLQPKNEILHWVLVIDRLFEFTSLACIRNG